MSLILLLMAKTVKNLRYALLKNPEHLSVNQQAQLQFLTKANPKLYRAYLLKEDIRLALKAGPDDIAAARKLRGMGLRTAGRWDSIPLCRRQSTWLHPLKHNG